MSARKQGKDGDAIKLNKIFCIPEIVRQLVQRGLEQRAAQPERAVKGDD